MPVLRYSLTRGCVTRSPLTAYRDDGKRSGQQKGGVGSAIAQQVKQQRHQRGASALSKQARGPQHAACAAAAMSRR